MRTPARTRLAVLLAVAALAAALSVTAEPDPPDAAAHTTNPKPSAHRDCNNPTHWIAGTITFGYYDCHTRGDWHYRIASRYRRPASGPGPGITCDTNGRCVENRTVTCEQPSQTAQCANPGGWKHIHSSSTDVYSHVDDTKKKPVGCGSNKHRHGDTCHRHPLTPPPNWVPYCGI